MHQAKRNPRKKHFFFFVNVLEVMQFFNYQQYKSTLQMNFWLILRYYKHMQINTSNNENIEWN